MEIGTVLLVVFLVAVSSFVAGTLYGRKIQAAAYAKAEELKESAKAEAKKVLHL